MTSRKNNGDSLKNTKEHIRSVATTLFNEIGYDETSIPMICEKAGVSKTTLHYYFPKKQDLFFDMNNNFEERFSNNFSRIVEQSTFTKQILEIFNIMCEGDMYYGTSTTQYYFMQRLKEHSQRDFINTIYHKKMLTAIIRSAQSAGQMKNTSDPERISEALSFAVRGVIVTWAIENGTLDLYEYSRQVVRTIIDPAEGYDI